MHSASQGLPLAQLVADFVHLDIEIATYDVWTYSTFKSVKNPFEMFKSVVPVCR